MMTKEERSKLAWQAVGETAQDLAVTVAPYTGATKRPMLEQIEQLVAKHGGTQLAEAFVKFARAVESAQSIEDPCGACHGSGEDDKDAGILCWSCNGRGYEL